MKPTTLTQAPYNAQYAITPSGAVFKWRNKDPGRKILKPFWKPVTLDSGRGVDNGSRLRVCRDGTLYLKEISQLVLETFGLPRPSKRYIACHLDGDVTNSSISNLAWLTPLEAADYRKNKQA